MSDRFHKQQPDKVDPVWSERVGAWSEVSGSGTVTFSAPQQAATIVTFSQAGNYVLQLSASDASGNSGSVPWQVTVNPVPGTTQGWIGSPLNGAAVSGLVPITVAAGKTLASGTLTYYPSTNPNDVTVLNSDTTGSGKIGVLDTTTMNNGSYWITLQATDTSGDTSVQSRPRHSYRQLQAGPRHSNRDGPGCPRHRACNQHPAHLRQPQCGHQRRFRLWLVARHQYKPHGGSQRRCDLHAGWTTKDLLSNTAVWGLALPVVLCGFYSRARPPWNAHGLRIGLRRSPRFPGSRWRHLVLHRMVASTIRPDTSTLIRTEPRTPSARPETCNPFRIAAATG